MSYILDQITALTKQLYPTGRAFKMAIGGPFEKLHTALNLSEERVYNDLVSIKDSMFPDNANFTASDASDWERRLGMISNSSNPLSNRKLAIQRKMAHPGTIKARQHYLYLQGQLQDAGFNVYVYENRFDNGFGTLITKTPTQFSLVSYPIQYTEHAAAGVQHGDYQHGGAFGNMVANSITQTGDNSFGLGSDLRNTFFIGGAYPGEWASVLASREQEFRQLILKIKPVQTVAFLLINYI